MKLQELFEAVDTTSAESENIKSMKDEIDHCAKAIFGVHAGPVKDPKRSKEAIFYGVAHTKSNLVDARGKSVYLTFDNSTDSKEFEINSLVPLKIERGSDEDREIKTLYKKYDVRSKKKLGYIAYGDLIVLREIHVGKDIDTNTVKFIKETMRILSNKPAEEEPKDDEPAPKKEPKKEKPAPVKKKEEPAPKKKDVVVEPPVQKKPKEKEAK